MLITVFLSSLVLVFARQTQLAVTVAEQRMSQTQARWIADGVVQGVLADLQWSLDSGEVPSLDFVEPDAGQVGQGLYWILYNDTAENDLYSTKTFGLQSLCGLLNLNMPVAQLINQQALPLLPQMDSDLASVIYDWRDGDDEAGGIAIQGGNNSSTGGSGAETDYYLSRNVPYPAKNGAFTTVRELQLLRGFKPSIVFGEDTNRNGLLDQNENDGNASPPEDNANGRLDRGLLDYVSIYGQEPNVTVTGEERINVNDNASQPDLLALFQDVFDEDDAGRTAALIAQERSEGSFLSVLDVKRRLGSQLSDEDFEIIEPRLTITNQDTSTGLTNVLLAPEEVIAAVTGDEDMARDIVNARPLDGSTSLLWLLDAVDEEEAARVAGLFTTRSFQFSADIVALSGDGRGFVRLLAVFETLSDNGQEIEEPRVVQIQDLTHLGWPLDPEIRQDLRQGVSAEEVAAKYGSRIQ